MTQAPTMLRVDAIDAGYGQMQILHSVSVEVRKGQIATIIGPNGAGKSTVLRVILGLLKPSAGRVWFDGEDITDLPTHRIIERGVAFVPQGRIVFEQMTVLENLEMGGYTCRDDRQIQENLERCFSLFPVLAERSRDRAGTLSGGQQQMLAIGRAIMSGPQTVVLDEPSLGLAPKFVDVVFEILERMRADGFTMLMVEQNAARALEVADYGFVLEVGRNRFDGEGDSLLADDQVRRLYLGG